MLNPGDKIVLPDTCYIVEDVVSQYNRTNGGGMYFKFYLREDGAEHQTVLTTKELYQLFAGTHERIH